MMRPRPFHAGACTAAGLAPAVTVVLALLAYHRTLSPSISVADGVSDSGELAASAYVLGVAHPTGYPLYMLVGRLVSHLSLGEPAYSLNCFSAVCGALAAGLVAMLAGTLLAGTGRELGAHASESASPGHSLGKAGPYPAACGALAAGLFFAADPAFWLQATNTETRTLAMLLVMIVLVVLIRGQLARSYRPLALAWAVEGLALADHLLSLAIIPALLIATAMYAPAPGERVKGRALAARARGALRVMVALVPGLALYAYLPLRAVAAPSMNWGDPRTLPRFVWMVSGAQYRPLMGLAGGDVLPTIGQRVQALAGDMGAIVLLAGAAGFALLCVRQPRVAMMLGLCFVAGFAQSTLYGASAAADYLIVCEAIVATSAGYLLGVVLGASVFGGSARWRTRVVGSSMAALALVVAMGGVGYEVSQQQATAAQQDSTMARDYALLSLRGLPPRALVLAEGDADTFPLWYAQFALGVRQDVAVVNTDLLAWQWYAASVRAHYPWLRWDGAAWPGADGDLAVGGRDERAAARETAIIRANVGRVPIFWTTPDVVGEGACGMEPQGNLIRCVPLR